MGSYDEVHGGWRCGQSKAFGKMGRKLVPGDAVQLVHAPMTQEELESFYEALVAQPERDFMVDSGDGGALIVRDGIFVEWAGRPDPLLPAFSYLGYPLAEAIPPACGTEVSEEAGFCPVCTAVRNG